MTSSTSSFLSQNLNTSSPTLDTLVSHLLSSKRSLSSINHVFHANDLVTSTRRSLESHTIITARTIFLQNGVVSQLELLEKVQESIDGVAEEGAAEFQTVIQSLDAADARLKDTLNQLRVTMVEAGLRPEGEERRALVDFVDETGVEGLLTTIKESVTTAQEARKEFEDSNISLGEEIIKVKALLKSKKERIHARNVSDSPKSPVPRILQSMEEHAKEMADNLESLVSHFDLCVTAIKHTEGGGAAARKITGDLPEGIEIGLQVDDVPPVPISEAERKDMLEVLEKDASEVEDVIMEIKDHFTDMESQFEQVLAHTDQLADDCRKTTTAFGLLEELAGRLPNYVMQSHIFLLKWDEEKSKIEARMEELEGLREFYDGFLRAYDNLIIEIGRRKSMESKMDKVIQDAMAKVGQLYEEDVAERDAFRQEQGDFLPGDIWPGLMASPLRYGISAVDGNSERVPDISKSVIQRAIRRVHGKV
ncbi:autophagy protein 17 [Schaereria dolodes]|nr:autophagy protein 17 [Schaereria dolodes]